MTFLSPFNQWEFSVYGKMGNSLFSKDVYSPPFLSQTSPPTQSSLPFALASSSFAILSAGSTIEKKIRENGAVNSLISVGKTTLM